MARYKDKVRKSPEERAREEWITGSLAISDTFMDAIRELEQDKEGTKSTAYRWGLWDGWTARPYSLTSLVYDHTGPADAILIRIDYEEGRDLGFSLRKRHQDKIDREAQQQE